MGAFEFGPVSVAGAEGFTKWTRDMIVALRQLMNSGEITPIPLFDETIALYERVMTTTESLARSARAAGDPVVEVVSVPMTADEHRRLRDIGRAIESYVGMLAAKGLVDMDLGPEEAECMAALVNGGHTGD